MNTEITGITNTAGRGVVLYDGTCRICSGGATRWRDLLMRHGFTLLPLQDTRAAQITKLPKMELMRELHVVAPDGSVHRGLDAVLFVAPAIP